MYSLILDESQKERVHCDDRCALGKMPEWYPRDLGTPWFMQDEKETLNGEESEEKEQAET